MIFGSLFRSIAAGSTAKYEGEILNKTEVIRILILLTRVVTLVTVAELMGECSGACQGLSVRHGNAIIQRATFATLSHGFEIEPEASGNSVRGTKILIEKHVVLIWLIISKCHEKITFFQVDSRTMAMKECFTQRMLHPDSRYWGL